MIGDLELPVTFSKAAPSYGAGALAGHRSDEIAKALKPPTPNGPMPVKKAPTLARTGAKPVKGALVPKMDPTPGADVVGKRLSTVSKDVSVKQRSKLAGNGDALPGGAFPMGDKAHVVAAERDLHFTKNPKERAAAGRLIKKREKQLHMVSKKSTEGQKKAFRRGAWAGGTIGAVGGVVGGGPIGALIGGAFWGTAGGLISRAAYTNQKAHDDEIIRRVRQTQRKANTGQRVKVTKAYRSFDPEERRQRRLGAASAASAGGGGLLIASGVKRIKEDTDRVGNWKMRAARRRPVKAADSDKHQAVFARGEIHDVRHAKVVRPSAAGKVGAGAALLGAAGALMADHHKRSWK